jgi:hypothetical protein
MKSETPVNLYLSNVSRFGREYYFIEVSQAWSFVPSGKSNVYITMRMEQWWSVTDTEIPNYSEQSVCQCHFLH